MKIDPDGSLPRITSSAKDLKNNVRIIKVPNSVPSYKLVVIRPTIEHEKLSEKSSDAELSDDDLFDIEFPSKSVEKEKIVDTKTDNLDKQNEADDEVVMRERNHYNRPRRFHSRNNRWLKNHGRRSNNFNNISKKCKSLSNMREVFNYGNRDLNPSSSREFTSAGNRSFNSAPSGRDINSAADGRDINSAAGGRDINSVPVVRGYNVPDFQSTPNQDFKPTVDHHVPYKNDKYQHSSDFPISPWLNFQPRHPQYPHTAFPGNPRHPPGFSLLGCPPYPRSVPPFQSNNPNLFCDETAPYSSMSSNFSSNNHNSFGHNQNSRNNNYGGNYRKNNQPRNKHMIDDNNHKQNTWNNRPRRHPNERNNSSRNKKTFDYRK